MKDPITSIGIDVRHYTTGESDTVAIGRGHDPGGLLIREKKIRLYCDVSSASLARVQRAQYILAAADDAPMQKENERLSARVAQLEAQLADARQYAEQCVAGHDKAAADQMKPYSLHYAQFGYSDFRDEFATIIEKLGGEYPVDESRQL